MQYDYFDSDGDVLLLKKGDFTNRAGLQSKSIEAYDIKTGKLLGEFVFDDKDYDIRPFSATITNDKIHVFMNTYQKSKSAKSLGYGHLTLDKQSLKEENRQFMLWKDLKAAIPGVNEFGKVGKDWMMGQDFIVTSKGNVLMIAEAFSTKGATNLLTNTQTMYALLQDMYLIEFDPAGKITFSKKVEKKNSVQMTPGITAMEMKENGVFDYMFRQKLNKNGDFVFFYTNNDQEGGKKKVAKNPLWKLGIVSNVDGEYGFETLQLYGEDLKIYPGLAKNGYIRLLEVNQKTYEGDLRLEKINY